MNPKEFLSGQEFNNEFARSWRERLKQRKEEELKKVEYAAMAAQTEQREIKK